MRSTAGEPTDWVGDPKNLITSGSSASLEVVSQRQHDRRCANPSRSTQSDRRSARSRLSKKPRSLLKERQKSRALPGRGARISADLAIAAPICRHAKGPTGRRIDEGSQGRRSNEGTLRPTEPGATKCLYGPGILGSNLGDEASRQRRRLCLCTRSLGGRAFGASGPPLPTSRPAPGSPLAPRRETRGKGPHLAPCR